MEAVVYNQDAISLKLVDYSVLYLKVVVLLYRHSLSIQILWFCKETLHNSATKSSTLMIEESLQMCIEYITSYD